MVVFALAVALAMAPPQVPPPPGSPPQAATPEAPVRLEDVTVTGRRLDQLIHDFVAEVAAPNRHRGIARWNSRICVGVANLRSEPAHYIVDRVSTVAADLGLEPGAPGCTPNVIVIASGDPDGLARDLVSERGRAFRMGGAGMDRGGDALEAFVSSGRPVRWWQVSMPTDSESGGRATRIPGECRGACASPMDMAPILQIFAASRVQTQIVDYIFRTVVIVDIDQVGRVSGQQLADYVAMVTLAQIDPDADTSRYASILNVFEDPESAAGLTDWDQAYLQGLYDAERTRKDLRAGRTEIADSIYRAHQDLHAAVDE